MVQSELLEKFHIENWFALVIAILTDRTSEKALEEMDIKPMKNPPKKLNLTYEQAWNIRYVLTNNKSWQDVGETYGINGEALRQQVYNTLKNQNRGLTY